MANAGHDRFFNVHPNGVPVNLFRKKYDVFINKQANPLFKGFEHAPDVWFYNAVIISQGIYQRATVQPDALQWQNFMLDKTLYNPGVDVLELMDATDDFDSTNPYLAFDVLQTPAVQLKWQISQLSNVDSVSENMTTVQITWVARGCLFKFNPITDPCDVSP